MVKAMPPIQPEDRRHLGKAAIQCGGNGMSVSGLKKGVGGQ